MGSMHLENVASASVPIAHLDLDNLDGWCAILQVKVSTPPSTWYHCTSRFVHLQTICWQYFKSTVDLDTNILWTFFAYIWSGSPAFITENQQKNYFSLRSCLSLIIGQSLHSQLNKYLFLAHNQFPIIIIGINTNILSGGLSNVR